MTIDIERLVQFHQVAQAGSLPRAARRLGIKQGALARQIRQLENQLGFALFERDGRFAALTPEGDDFLDCARDMAEAARHVQALARSLGAGQREVLVLGTSDTTFWIPARRDLMAQVAQAAPGLTIDTVVRNSTGLIEALDRRDLDVCIVGIGRDMDRFDYLTLHRSRPLLLIPPGHPLADQPTLTMDDMRDLDIAIPVIDNDYAFAMIYAPFLHAGAIPRWIAEGPLAAVHRAIADRVCMIGWGFEQQVNSALLCRPIAGCDAEIQVVAARHRDDQRPAVAQFWAVAETIARACAADWALRS